MLSEPLPDGIQATSNVYFAFQGQALLKKKSSNTGINTSSAISRAFPDQVAYADITQGQVAYFTFKGTRRNTLKGKMAKRLNSLMQHRVSKLHSF